MRGSLLVAEAECILPIAEAECILPIAEAVCISLLLAGDVSASLL